MYISHLWQRLIQCRDDGNGPIFFRPGKAREVIRTIKVINDELGFRLNLNKSTKNFILINYFIYSKFHIEK